MSNEPTNNTPGAQDIDKGGLRTHLQNIRNQDTAEKRSTRKLVGIGAVTLIAVALYVAFVVGGWKGIVFVAVVTVTPLIYFFWRKRAQRNELARREEEKRLRLEREQEEEQRQLELRRLAEEREDRHNDIVALRNKRRRSMVVFVGNQAGDGSKTTTCAYLALTFIEHLKSVPVIIVECRRDSAQGVDKHRLDSASVTSIRKFYQAYSEGKLNDENGWLSNELIMEMLALSPGGVCYLQADLEAPKPDPFSESEGPAATVIEVLKTTGAIVIIDMGNNPTDPITIGMANNSALGVFPSLPKSKSLTLRRRTISTFKDHLDSTIVDDSITVLNAYAEDQDLEFLKKELAPLPDDPHRFFVTRYDHWMEDEPVTGSDGNISKTADLTQILPENRDEFEMMVQELLAIFVAQGERKP